MHNWRLRAKLTRAGGVVTSGLQYWPGNSGHGAIQEHHLCKWMWVKMEDLGDHRCQSSLVLTIQLLGYLILTHTQMNINITIHLATLNHPRPSKVRPHKAFCCGHDCSLTDFSSWPIWSIWPHIQTGPNIQNPQNICTWSLEISNSDCLFDTDLGCCKDQKIYDFFKVSWSLNRWETQWIGKYKQVGH